ncbi:hypothetical protein DFH09DRAFT_918112 [Mycena vulgaris]|nr:hypothetical protein DFH09DRAFT_918112 [Mycena vulgaris]
MAAQNPHLPVELMEEIIATAWHLPLSSRDRITFMRSSLLVNSTWADTFDLVSSRDVFIPSSAFCDHWIQRLRAPTPSVPRSANLACQSITIQLANVDVHPDKHNRMRMPMGAVLDNLLENLDARSLAPNLRRLTIEYLDATFGDVFHRAGLAALPSQITHLELRYSFGSETPAWLVKALKDKEERQRNIGWVSRSITDLSVVGAGENTVSDMLRACTNARILDGERGAPTLDSTT